LAAELTNGLMFHGY